jgi:hypothetical protein
MIPLYDYDLNTLEDVLIAIHKLCDKRGLKIAISPKVVWFQSKDFSPDDILNLQRTGW